jgi:hypothetical protein
MHAQIKKITNHNIYLIFPGVAKRYIKNINPIIGINISNASNRLLPISFNLLQTFAIFIIERVIIRIGIN